MRVWRFGALNANNLSKCLSTQYGHYQSVEFIQGIRPVCHHNCKFPWRGCFREPGRGRGGTKRQGSGPPFHLELLDFYLFYILRFYIRFCLKKILPSKGFKKFSLFGCIQTKRKSTLSPCFLGPCRSAIAHLCFRLCLRLYSKATIRKNFRESTIICSLHLFYESPICKKSILQTSAGESFSIFSLLGNKNYFMYHVTCFPFRFGHVEAWCQI